MELQDRDHEINNERLTWDRKECAKQIGVSERTLDRMVAAGRIPVLYVRSKKLFVPASIKQWMMESQKQPRQ